MVRGPRKSTQANVDKILAAVERGNAMQANIQAATGLTAGEFRTAVKAAGARLVRGGTTKAPRYVVAVENGVGAT